MPALRPDLNGHRIRIKGSIHVYLVERGLRRHVPNPETYASLFKDVNGILDLEAREFDDITEGAEITVGALLAKAVDRPEVYMVESIGKRHIIGPAVFDAYYFDWKRRHEVPRLVIEYMASGPPITL